MSKIDEYHQKLKELKDWTPYLRKNSGLPGPRGNLELAQAVAEQITKGQIEEFLSIPPEQAGENTPGVFLVFCGVLGLGKLAAGGEHDQFARLLGYASDSRWRIREATAMALQFVGDQDIGRLLKEMRKWSRAGWYEKRAAAAALAEPRLLRDPQTVLEVLGIFDTITADIASAGDTKNEAFKVLRQGMGYCWSVAVAALPGQGKSAMEEWLKSQNPDVRWIMKENLKKNRLLKMDAGWVKACNARLE
ncbi:MAG: hypothetical protein A2W33_09115 [Chloroflexi bacterium RBG_16_52_11]|nr:MAG: hypothetical protein A2W33_09115 [Chloroflexi bacterium RBG_16_52_11]